MRKAQELGVTLKEYAARFGLDVQKRHDRCLKGGGLYNTQHLLCNHCIDPRSAKS